MLKIIHKIHIYYLYKCQIITSGLKSSQKKLNILYWQLVIEIYWIWWWCIDDLLSLVMHYIYLSLIIIVNDIYIDWNLLRKKLSDLKIWTCGLSIYHVLVYIIILLQILLKYTLIIELNVYLLFEIRIHINCCIWKLNNCFKAILALTLFTRLLLSFHQPREMTNSSIIILFLSYAEFHAANIRTNKPVTRSNALSRCACKITSCKILSFSLFGPLRSCEYKSFCEIERTQKTM